MLIAIYWWHQRVTELENEKLNFKEQLDKANERVALIQKEQDGESDALIILQNE